jgi:CubicO group peptidase (beta-lactamase class C family)
MKGIAAFEAVVAAANLPGAVALITDSKDTRYTRAFGMADAVAGVPMREDTLFQIASMTKALTSVAVLQLVERGKLDLDAAVGSILPELAEPQVLDGFDADGAPILRAATTPVTLRHLLLHTSGCGYTFMDADLLRHAMATGKMAAGKRASLDLPLRFEPGTNWQYGVGIDWAGLAVEAVTGMTLGEWFEREITGPLGMTQTRFRAAWEALGAGGEVLEAFALNFKSVAEAVAAIIDTLGLAPCEGSGGVKAGTNKHQAMLAGTFLGDVKVLSRLQVTLDAETGCSLKIAIRAADKAFSEMLMQTIVS